MKLTRPSYQKSPIIRRVGDANTNLTGRAFFTVFPNRWDSQLTSGRKGKRSETRTLILMAIIESSVWLSLTLAEALRLPTHPRVKSNFFQDNPHRSHFFPNLSASFLTVETFPVEHSPLEVEPRPRPQSISLRASLKIRFPSCHVASRL